MLESRQFERLGGNTPIQADVRIITATNKDLKKMVEERKFREDLYYRINVFPIRIPPLRERRDDVPLLTDYFLKEFSAAFGRKTPILTEKVLERLRNHPWKGNIRKLRNVLERAMILAGGDQITSRHVILNETQERPPGTIPLDQIISRAVREEGINLEALESTCIKKAMESSNQNVSRAARKLGLSRATLRYRLEKM